MLHRIEVRPKPGLANPRAESVRRDAAALGLNAAPTRVEHADVYLIEADLPAEDVRRLAEELLADPVTQAPLIGAAPPTGDAYIEVQPLPGVMDPAAEAVQTAIRAMLGIDARVQTGQRYDLFGVDGAAARTIAERALANTVIHAIHEAPFTPAALPRGAAHDFRIVEVPLRDLDDAALEKLSRDAHLFLSLEEMQAIRDEYRRLGREPREIELETLAQTWSEHCVHKTLKATIRYVEWGKASRNQGIEASSGEGSDLPSPPGRGAPGIGGEGSGASGIIDFTNRPGHVINPDGSVTIHNLLKSTVAAATHELIRDGIDWCLSVFVDNAGVIAFDDQWAVCFKCETHNHPSAIEPYGGAATGIGGCIRDIIGTGLAAKPIAATDVFCVAHPDLQDVPKGCLHPRRVLTQVVAGVRDYGNRMGIPTVNGGVWFDDRYVGNPLVYCGVIGVMPRDLIAGSPGAGDRIIALGGRTGRDGIHGATFSSAELTDTHADEFAHAVQIGNAVTEKMLLDAILEARDTQTGPLFSAITDCGAGGFSSAVGEMGKELGAFVTLENAPLKYEGLSPTEIWISEAQERMVLAVPPGNVAALRAICNKHGVEMCDLGHFGTPDADLILTYKGVEVGRMPMHFLHEGIPNATREAEWMADEEQENGGAGEREAAASKPGTRNPELGYSPALRDTLLRLLAHPNIASKRWIIRQYDHEVQGGSVVKPIVGAPGIDGPSDAAVIRPVGDSDQGLAIGNGLATGLAADPYLMALAAIDECVRNLVCVGADPSRIAILDNFCWPSCRKPRNLGSLVRAAEGCYDGAKAYRTPFISGKDSLNNQFTTEDGRTIEIPPTLLISGIGIVPDVAKCVTMDAKRAGHVLVIVGETTGAMGGSHVAMVAPELVGDRTLPRVDLSLGPAIARAVHELITAGLVRSAHDCSEGGLLVAAAEMAFSGDLGLRLDLAGLPGAKNGPGPWFRCFAETPSRYLLEVATDDLPALRRIVGNLPAGVIGWFDDTRRLRLVEDDDTLLDVGIDELRETWLSELDW
ncbi:MAG: phosphoribosylformylglycinamidine synthase subunit PurL [Phycisphaeraceae bacterium]|nr:MAG: phosphoribosylformylglycinamidine synthase subunit PurL [Phycisphaeraceae bacterium]